MSLTGQLLVASPQVDEGVFRRGVVLVLHHSDEGAQGVLLNVPHEADIGSVLPEVVNLLPDASVIYQGGPVGLDSVLGLARLAPTQEPPNGVKPIVPGIAVVDLDNVGDQLQTVAPLRLFLGYAGWTSGQLEAEILRGDWFVVDRLADDLFADDPEGLWHRVLARQQGQLALLATYPDDPNLN